MRAHAHVLCMHVCIHIDYIIMDICDIVVLGAFVCAYVLFK